MVMNISCKFEKSSYIIFFVRLLTVKSLYTLQLQRRQRNKAKSTVSTRYKPLDTLKQGIFRLWKENTIKFHFWRIWRGFYENQQTQLATEVTVKHLLDCEIPRRSGGQKKNMLRQSIYRLIIYTSAS